MKSFLVFQKKKNAWSNLETLIVLVSFLLTATDESASARNVQIACAKRGGGRGEGGGRKGSNPPPLFPFLPIPYLLSPTPTPFDACYAGYVQIVGTTQRKTSSKKKRRGQGERERKAPFLPLPFLCFFPSALWLVPEVTQRSTKKTFLFHSAIPRTHDQRAVVDFRSR